MGLRYTTAVAFAAGVSLAASIFGAQRIAVALLVLVVLMLAAAVEVLRRQLDKPKDRP